jgi:hypothetical protein
MKLVRCTQTELSMANAIVAAVSAAARRRARALYATVVEMPETL